MVIAQNRNKNINFVRIIQMLKKLRERGEITEAEYRRARRYYQKMTGADLVVAD